MDTPDSISTPSLATVFFDKFEKDELQEILTTKPLDWLFAQNVLDDKQADNSSGLLTNITNPIQENLTNYVLLIEKHRPKGSINKKEESFDLREMQQMIRELTVGIHIFDELPSVTLRPKYDRGTFVDIPPAYIDTHVAQCMTELDYLLKSLWHGAHFARERRQKFTERWTDLMNLNKEGMPETNVDKLAIFRDSGMMEFSKDPSWEGYYDNTYENINDVEACRALNKEILDNIGLFLILKMREASQYKNMLIFSVEHDLSSFKRKDLEKLEDDVHQPLTCWLQSQRSQIREWFEKKPRVRQLLAKVKTITALCYFLVSMKKFSMVPDISAYLPSLTTEQVKTEDSLPPLMLHPDTRSSNKLFSNTDMYCHLHGCITIGKDAITLKPASAKLTTEYDKICDIALQQNHKKLKGSGDGNLYPMAEVDIGGKTYVMLAVELEKFLVQSPKSPRWLHTIADGAAQTRKRVFPVSESRIVEQFNRRFGSPQQIATSQLLLAVELGKSAVFQAAMTKSTKSRISKCDSTDKLSMLHRAVMKDFPNLVCDMVRVWGCGVNVQWENDSKTVFGPTPLHVAAMCGSVESTYCLLNYNADMNLVDGMGWLPVHVAAYHNQHVIMRLMLNKNPKLIESLTQNAEAATPLLLACSSGALDAVTLLLRAGANPTVLTRSQRGVIHKATLHRHVNVLELFIKEHIDGLPVWDILVKMINTGDHQEKYYAVLALDTLTSGCNNWKELLTAKTIPALVNILKPDPMAILDDAEERQLLELRTNTAKVIRNISTQNPVRSAIAETNSIKTFIGLLSIPYDLIQSYAAEIVSDICQVDNNAEKVAKENGIAPLINLLKSGNPTVQALTSAMTALKELAENHPSNKDEIARKDGVEPLVSLLESSEFEVQASAANALKVIAHESESIQNHILSIGGIPPLVSLLKNSKNMEVQVSAAGAVKSLAHANAMSQSRIAELDGITPLIRLLKSNPRNLEVQEKASGALWALSGDDPTKRREIGIKIGIEMLVVLLESKSEKIQFVASKALSTLASGAPKLQTKIRESGGVLPLVRMLKQSASERVLLAVINTLAALSIELAHKPVNLNQSKIAGGGAIKPLVALVTGTANEIVKVQSAYALACITLAHPENQKELKRETSFNFKLLIDLLYSSDKEVSQGAGRALTTFAYNNIPAQKEIVNSGEIKYSQFLSFLSSESEDEQAHAAFQVVVLARVMTGEDHVVVMACGIEVLASLLDSQNELIQELAANFIASLAHTRAGIPAAIVTVGAVTTLISMLNSPHELVRTSTATALGYLTYNRDAMRLLLSACRRKPEIYNKLVHFVGDGKVSDVFKKEWDYCVLKGLPIQRMLENMYAYDNPSSTLEVPAKTITETMESPTFAGTVSDDILEGESHHRYTSASTAV